jgi:hypothetical protein
MFVLRQLALTSLSRSFILLSVFSRDIRATSSMSDFAARNFIVSVISSATVFFHSAVLFQSHTVIRTFFWVFSEMVVLLKIMQKKLDASNDHPK